jgi:hypothetical protein
MLIALALLPLVVNPGSVASATSPAAPLAQAERVDVRAKFVELHAKNDAAGCEKLWKEHPGDVLGAIDADLEGSLATWELSPGQPDVQRMLEQQKRALWGAKLASQASGNPLFLDYASAFVGWNDGQKKQFRAGQAAYGRARSALKAKDFAAAAAAARECAELAAPLGDWWGQAMGLSALGQTFASEGKHAEAIGPLAQAALVYRDLQLVGDEYNATRTLAGALRATGALQRAHAALERASTLAEVLGDAEGRKQIVAQLEELRTQLDAASKR